MAGHGPDDTLAGLAEAKKNEFEYEKKYSLENVTSSVEHEVDDVHEGLEFPSEEERHTLRRVSDKIPWSAYRKLDLSHLPLLS